MKKRNIFCLAVILALTLIFAGCSGDEPTDSSSSSGEEEYRVETTLDEAGNLIREDFYNEDDELEEYVIYEYDENNVLKQSSGYDGGGVKRYYVEYAYGSSGKLFTENTVHVDVNGKQLERFLVEYYESGNKHKVSSFDENDVRFSYEELNENGVCIYSDISRFDENGTYIGRSVIAQNDNMLVTMQEEYDASNVLVTGSTFSYHDNGEMKELKSVNKNGDIITHSIKNENGDTIYSENNTFHDNGKISDQSVEEKKDGGITAYRFRKFDANGKMISDEYTESDGKAEIKCEKYGPDGSLIYYKDAAKYEESFFTESGAFTGKRYVEYYKNGDMKLEKEYDAKGNSTLLREYSENGIILVNESSVYSASGKLLEYSYEKISENDVILKNERVKYDESGKVIEKFLAEYDSDGNVVLDERIENGVLTYKYSAEYYGKEKIKKEESYQNDGISVRKRIAEYDKDGRTLYQYDLDENKTLDHKIETYVRYRYNSAGEVVYFENKMPGGDKMVEEYYDNGQPKKQLQYDREGNLVHSSMWDENGNPIS